MKDLLAQIIPSLEKIRKEIHQDPEVSQLEFNTAKRIKSFLEKHSDANIKNVANTGVLAIFDSNTPGPEILLRADTDALPIEEINTFDHKSKNRSVSHKCGHDGHTTMMLGVAVLLSKQPLKKGSVTLLFQPAEENGKGAQAVLANPYFQGQSFDYVFALHNIPGVAKNKIVIKEDIFNANVKSMIVKLKGKTAHAAEPEMGYNPALAIAGILQFADNLTLNNPDNPNFFLVTPVHMQMGELAYGISAGEGELHFTTRSWNLDVLNENCKTLTGFIEDTCAEHHLTFEIEWTQAFYANRNHPKAIEIIRNAAKVNNFKIHEMSHSFKWGEDFGLFTQQYKGAMFGLGAGENQPALHNPDYDFPDEIIPTGIMQFYQIIQELHKV